MKFISGFLVAGAQEGVFLLQPVHRCELKWDIGSFMCSWVCHHLSREVRTNKRIEYKLMCFPLEVPKSSTCFLNANAPVQCL